MWFHSLFASMKSGLSRSRRPQPANRSTRLFVEHLEDRTVPSTFNAATVSDLIADINAANTAGGANTITLTAPTNAPYAPYALLGDYNGGHIGQTGNGLPVIAANDNLTTVGNGHTIHRGAGSFRFFRVATLASLTLQTLTLYGGGAASAGGAIYNQGALTLSGVTLADNVVSGVVNSGGAIWS